MSEKTIILNNGERMPAIMLGTFRTRGPDVRTAVNAALRSGYRGIDTAAVYRNHTEIANTLQDVLPTLNLERKDIFLTSKLSPSDQGRDKCFAAVERILDELKTDYLDLFLIHWPGVSRLDVSHQNNRKLRLESWKVLEEFHKSGILKCIGVSNFTVKHLEDLLENCQVVPHVNQVEIHPHYPQHQLVDYCNRNSIHVQAYSSLGQDGPKSELFKSEIVNSISRKINKTVPQVLLQWGLQHGYSVLPKSKDPNHIKQNIDLHFCLTDTDIQELDVLYKTEQKKYAWNPETVF